MKRRLLVLVAVLLAMCVPAMADVGGTKWAGVDSDGDAYTVWFRPGGKLAYSSPTAGHKEDAATWVQKGDEITWDFNNGYARYTAHVAGDSMRGEAVNIKDHKWTFEWKRVTADMKVQNTTWQGKDAEWTLHFKPGGKVDLGGKKPASGTWTQYGDEVDIQLLEGKLVLHGWLSGNELTGRIGSAEKEEGSWTATLVNP